MQLHFSKYHGTGNDFVLVDAIEKHKDLSLTTEQIKSICDRRFGVGADGFMFLRADADSDFFMDYYNSDGKRSSMCGNGGRCIVQFAGSLNCISHSTTFRAVDGMHQAIIDENGQVSLAMNAVSKIQKIDQAYVLNTGSPHYVSFVNDLLQENIVEFGKQIRYNDTFMQEGINVNLVELNEEGLSMQTYERGVEDETFSCGTGMVAAAISAATSTQNFADHQEYKIKTKGGLASVNFDFSKKKGFCNINLVGPAIKVFEGILEI